MNPFGGLLISFSGRRPYTKDFILGKVRKGASTSMAKVTSKLQVTLPKAIAEQYGIQPGDEIDWVPAGDVIRVIPAGKTVAPDDRAARLRIFDQATERLRRRRSDKKAAPPSDRGWTREDLYDRGRSN